MFDAGDRVQTPSGVGTVVYRRMGATDSEVAAYSVKLDGRDHVGAIFGAAKVTRLDEGAEWHVVTSQGGRVLAVYGAALLADAQAAAKRVQGQTGWPAWLDKAVGPKPRVGDEWKPRAGGSGVKP